MLLQTPATPKPRSPVDSKIWDGNLEPRGNVFEKVGEAPSRASASYWARARRTPSPGNKNSRFLKNDFCRFSNEARHRKNFSFALTDRSISESSFADNRREIVCACDSRSASTNRHFQQLFR